jgi:hypothetical protein
VAAGAAGAGAGWGCPSIDVVVNGSTGTSEVATEIRLFTLFGSADESDAIALLLSEGMALVFSFAEERLEADPEFVLAALLLFGCADVSATGREMRTIASCTICAKTG